MFFVIISSTRMVAVFAIINHLLRLAIREHPLAAPCFEQLGFQMHPLPLQVVCEPLDFVVALSLQALGDLIELYTSG